jgi:hypothetical protein
MDPQGSFRKSYRNILDNPSMVPQIGVENYSGSSIGSHLNHYLTTTVYIYIYIYITKSPKNNYLKTNIRNNVSGIT